MKTPIAAYQNAAALKERSSVRYEAEALAVLPPRGVAFHWRGSASASQSLAPISSNRPKGISFALAAQPETRMGATGAALIGRSPCCVPLIAVSPLEAPSYTELSI